MIVKTRIIRRRVKLRIMRRRVLQLPLGNHLINMSGINLLLNGNPNHMPRNTKVRRIVIIRRNSVLANNRLGTLINITKSRLVLFRLLVPSTYVSLHANLRVLTCNLILANVRTTRLPILMNLIRRKVRRLIRRVRQNIMRKRRSTSLKANELVIYLPSRRLRQNGTIDPRRIPQRRNNVFPPNTNILPRSQGTIPTRLARRGRGQRNIPSLTTLTSGVPRKPNRLPRNETNRLIRNLFRILNVTTTRKGVTTRPLGRNNFLITNTLNARRPIARGVRLLLVTHSRLNNNELSHTMRDQLLNATPTTPTRVPMMTPTNRFLNPTLDRITTNGRRRRLSKRLHKRLRPNKILRRRRIYLPNDRYGKINVRTHPIRNLFRYQNLNIRRHDYYQNRLLHGTLYRRTTTLRILLYFLYFLRLRSSFSASLNRSTTRVRFCGLR